MTSERLVVLDDLPAPAALVDQDGIILAVNTAWLEFGRANGAPDPGTAVGFSYRDWLDDPDPDAARAAAGVFSVIDGSAAEFSFTYPCHSPTEQRWFRFLTVPTTAERDAHLVVAVHLPLGPETDRHLHEFAHDALDRPHPELVLCAWCRERSQTANGAWGPIALDLGVAASISHGICPDCLREAAAT